MLIVATRRSCPRSAAARASVDRGGVLRDSAGERELVVHSAGAGEQGHGAQDDRAVEAGEDVLALLAESTSRSRSSAPANTVHVELMLHRTALRLLEPAARARAGRGSSRPRCSRDSARNRRRSGRSSGTRSRSRGRPPGSPSCPGRRCRAPCACSGKSSWAPRPWQRISERMLFLGEGEGGAAVAGADAASRASSSDRDRPTRRRRREPAAGPSSIRLRSAARGVGLRKSSVAAAGEFSTIEDRLVEEADELGRTRRSRSTSRPVSANCRGSGCPARSRKKSLLRDVPAAYRLAPPLCASSGR